MDSWDNRFLSLTSLVASWSKDPSTKVGAVIVDEKNRILALGFNGFPRGISDDDRLQDRNTKYEMIVHAEINAILQGKDVEGATLYSTFFPCPRCAAVIIQAGIKRVVSQANVSDLRWKESRELSESLLREAGVSCQLVP